MLAGRCQPRRGAGLIAAGLFAVAPSLVFWSASLFSEPFFTLGVACTLAVAAWAGDRRSMAGHFAAGVALTATSFVRSQGMLLIAPVAWCCWRRCATGRWPSPAAASRTTGLWPRIGARDVLRVATPVVAAIALLVVPWAIRNARSMGQSVPDQRQPRLQSAPRARPVFAGHVRRAAGSLGRAPGISFNEREKSLGDAGRSRALTYAREHPGRELELALHRLGYLSRSDAAASVRWSESLGATPVGASRCRLLGDLYYYPVVALAFASIVAASRKRWLALWSSIAAWGALHLVFAGEPRYHVPLMPVVVVLAAATLVRIADLVLGDSARFSRRPPPAE